MKKAILFTLLVVGALVSPGIYAHQKQIPGEFPSTVLTTWMRVHCQMVRSAKGIGHVAFSRHFSYSAIAAYESIVGSDPSYHSLAGQLNALGNLPPAPPDIHWPASLNAAYATMLRQYYSSFGDCKARIDSVEKGLKDMFSKSGVNPEKIEKAQAYGQSVAAAIIEWSALDGANKTAAFIPLPGEGTWVPTPPGFMPAAVPHWVDNRSMSKDLVKAFVLKQPDYSTDPSSSFYAMAKEVFTISKNLTPEQKATAIYWDDAPDGRYISVFGHWTSIFCGLLDKHPLSLLKATEAYVKMAISLYEAAILTWKGKYQYQVLRPVTYIQKNFDKTWMPLITTPNHPEFPAAHATLSNAAATALCASFGYSCPVVDNSYVDIGMKERKFNSIQEAAREAGMSRLYGGIHYRYSIEQGLALGERTAKHVLGNIVFQSPNPNKLQKAKP